MKHVSHLLEAKGQPVWFLPPNATVYKAIDQMAQKGIGALLVMEGEHLIGIISERDYVREVILKGKAAQETKIREIMSYPVHCARPELTVERAMALMTERSVRHLPVVVADRVVGVISMGDVVRGIIEDKQCYIQQLTNYVTGSR
jgi:CBS domain-containing protein